MGLNNLTREATPALQTAIRSGFHKVEEAVGIDAEKTVARQAEKSARKLERSAVSEVARFNAPVLARHPELLQAKYQRMAESAAAFFRGSDHLFSRDLYELEGDAMRQGVKTTLQGDLHMGNFGTVVQADGKLKFGMVDFDEAIAGPAMLDLKRFSTSIRLVAEENGLSKKEADELVKTFAKRYEKVLEKLAKKPGKKLPEAPELIQDLMKQAEKKDAGKWLEKVAPRVGGKRRFVRGERVTDVSKQTFGDVVAAFKKYQIALPASTAKTLEGHEVQDVVSVKAGIGSMGRARYRVVTAPPSGKHAAIFELKEELPSALQPYMDAAETLGPEAERAMAANQLINHVNPYVGTTTVAKRSATSSQSFLVRRLFPSLADFDPATLGKFKDFDEAVAYMADEIARGHVAGAETGAKGLLEGLPESLKQDLRDFSDMYARQVAKDHEAFVKALAKHPLLGQGGR
jgi:uncharacterized protein (DUF2252 family)